MSRLLFAAPCSGSGKTVVTCAFLQAALDRGLRVCSFKCGPDYIDPMFHRQVYGIPCANLDLFLTPEDTALRMLAARQDDLEVLEGVMGFYDGVGGTDQCSSWDLARRTRTPVVLVLRPGGTSLTLAAQVQGLVRFREKSGIAGILLNRCSAAQAAHLRPILEENTGLPVLGFLPELPQAAFESRHLGLLAPDEVKNVAQKLSALGRALAENADLDALLRLAQSAPRLCLPPAAPVQPECAVPVRVVVAQDEAFRFVYPENLELLRRLGAETVFFSPLRDGGLPRDVGALYLPGGYPELYAETLSRNEAVRQAVARAAADGMPVVAECGGFLYLHRTLEDPDGRRWPMCGVLPGEGIRTRRLQRFGYARLTAGADNLLLRAGESLPVHSFHYWDSTDRGGDLEAEKPDGRRWKTGFAAPALFAGFAHLYFYADPEIARRFVRAALAYQQRKGIS